VADVIGAHTVAPFPVPWDFAVGYQPAFWRRPEAYLDPRIRAASSTFATLPDSVVVPAMDRLRQDLDSGAWQERHRDLLDADAIDYGYRPLSPADATGRRQPSARSPVFDERGRPSMSWLAGQRL